MDISGYTTMRMIYSYRNESAEYYYLSEKDSLKIFRVVGEAAAETAVVTVADPETGDELIYAVSFDDLWRGQLEKIGATPKTVSRDILEENRSKMLELRTEHFALILDMIYVEFEQQQGATVSSVSVDYILTK